MKGKTWRLFQGLTPMRFGALGTLAIFAGVYWLGRQPAPGDAGGTRASEFWSLPLNSMGDALAGLAASLAFLWLIVTAFIQKNELKEQRKALEAQLEELSDTRREFELTRKVQEEQLNAMRVQADIFLDEQRQRAEDRADALLLEKRESLVFLVRTGRGPVWETAPKLESQDPYSQQLLPVLNSYDTEAAFTAICEEIVHRASVIWEASASGGLLATPEREAHLPVVCAKLEEIARLYREFSPGRQEYLERVKMCDAAKELRKMIESDLWAESETSQ